MLICENAFSFCIVAWARLLQSRTRSTTSASEIPKCKAVAAWSTRDRQIWWWASGSGRRDVLFDYLTTFMSADVDGGGGIIH